MHPNNGTVSVWKPDLYRLQQQAPRPFKIASPAMVDSRPIYYGSEYHGALSHKEAFLRLTNDGDYLVRKSAGQDIGIHTLSLRMNHRVHHYKLYYNGYHYITQNKKFDSLDTLVAEGLVTMYIEEHAGHYINLMHGLGVYEKSPFMTLNRSKRMAVRTTLKKQNIEQQVESVIAVNLTDTSDKPHSFKTHTFKGLNWCEFCGNFLWGFIAQGVKCDDCGFSAHARCSQKLPNDCCPDLKHIRGVFGIDLTTLVKVHRTQRPFVVEKCIEEIERRGLDTEGLYRVSGFADEIEALKLCFDKDGENADISSKIYDNINVIAGTLKLYFRLLPLPLITFEAHEAMVKSVQKKTLDEQLKGIKDSLTLLPTAHYDTLKYLIKHLTKVSDYQSCNKMTPYNLSTVFTPSLMPAPDLRNGLQITNEITALEKIICNFHFIFS